MIQCRTNTECDSGLTFFISHFRQCYGDKSVMPGGTFFPPAAPTERLAHNSILEAGRDAVSCSWVQPAVCVHASQHRDMNPALQVVNNCSLHPGRLLPVTGKERIKIRQEMKKRSLTPFLNRLFPAMEDNETCITSTTSSIFCH